MSSEICIINFDKGLSEQLETNVLDMNCCHQYNIETKNFICDFFLWGICIFHLFHCLHNLECCNNLKRFSDLMKLSKVFRGSSFILDTWNSLNLIQIWVNPWKSFTFLDFLHTFHEISRALLCHYSIVTFICHYWRKLIDDSNKTTPCWVSSSTDTLSDLEKAILCDLCIDRFHSRCKMMKFVKKIKFFLLNVKQELIVFFHDKLVRNSKSNRTS